MPVRTLPVSHRNAAAWGARRSALGGIALQNGLALENPFLGIALTKKQRYAKAVAKARKKKMDYLECKQKQINKGFAVYPDDPTSKKCKSKYKSMQKWRGKKGKRATKVAERAEKKGRLDPEAKAILDADIAAAMGEDENAALAMMQNMSDAEADAFMAENFATDDTMMYVGGAVVGLGGLVTLGFLGRRAGLF
jgi:hypothetical protein